MLIESSILIFMGTQNCKINILMVICFSRSLCSIYLILIVLKDGEWFQFFFFYYMRLLLRLQLIWHENITDIYKSDYNWGQHTSILMKPCPDCNPLKYSRNVYFSHWGKEADCLHSNLIKEGISPQLLGLWPSGLNFSS